MTLEIFQRVQTFSSLRAGIEPGTTSNRGKCLTAELPRFLRVFFQAFFFESNLVDNPFDMRLYPPRMRSTDSLAHL